MIARALLWLRSVLLRRRLEREMQGEMAEHLARSTERLIARGLSPEAARREASREFGNVTYLQEEGRIARGTHGLDALRADLRFAFRHFARNRMSTLTMVAVLSLGIAINVVLYTMVHSFIGRPPSGVEASDDVVRIRGSQLGEGSRVERAFSMDEVQAYTGLTTHFRNVAAWTSQPITASSPGVEEFTVTATFVTDDYFSVLGTQPLLGRALARGDAAQLAVVSHAAWVRSFAQDPAIIGRTITLGDVPLTIVGITRPKFRGAAWEDRNDMQVWVPVASHLRIFPDAPGDAERFLAIARLQPNVTREAAGAAALVVAGRVTSERKANAAEARNGVARDPSVEVVPLLADNLEPGAEANARIGILAFSALGLLTLLVTCANVGSLQTGLALSRRREIAIRMSLGAERGRVVRQLVTESLALSLLAGVGAVATTIFILRQLLWIVGTFSFELAFDQTAILFTFGVALLAGLLFGLSPALHATRAGVAGALKDSAGAIVGRRARLQRGLVVTQIALTQPLAVSVAALVLIGVAEFRRTPPNPNGAQIVQLRLASAGGSGTSGDTAAFDPAARAREQLETERLVEALREAPGVTYATFVPGRSAINVEAFRVPDAARPGSAEDEAFYVAGRAAMPGYLDLIGTPIVLGRDLGAADTAAYRAKVIPVVIGDDMARSLWGDASPIGRRVERAAGAATEPMTLEVVGVYREDVAAKGHSRNPFSIYVPNDPGRPGQVASRLIMLRVSSSAEAVTPAIRAIVRDEAPRAAIMELRTLAALQDEERFVLGSAIALFAAGGIVVLGLCALGLYAVVAFAVGQRTSEIAVRMAVGAGARQIVRHFASDGLRLTIIGVVVGLPLSIFGLRQLMALSPESPPVDLTLVMAVVAVGVLGVAGLASWLPASRAADVDPAVILRKE